MACAPASAPSAIEARTIRKMQMWIIPLVFMLFVIAFTLVLLGVSATGSVFFYVVLWSLVASGIYGLYGPFWSLPNEFLAGFSAAAGIALINSVGNLGGFVGPYAMGAITKRTGSFRNGLVFAGLSLLTSAILIVALRKRRTQRLGDGAY